MQVWFWLWLLVVLKIPVVGAGWMIWHVVRQTPDQEVIGGSEDGGLRFDPGPRRRGPHEGGRDGRKAISRRRDAGHDKAGGASSRPKQVTPAE
jgi:hypothetical protein